VKQIKLVKMLLFSGFWPTHTCTIPLTMAG
jgi:hypothetical protein